MNLLKSPLRRTTAVLAGAFIGLAGAVAFAAPASAHAPTVTGSTTCAKDGKWTIDWAIGNDYKTDATVSKIQLRPHAATITGPVTEPGKVIPAHSDQHPDAQVHGSTTVGTDFGAVVIEVWLHWADYDTPADKPARFRVGQPDACKPDTPPTTPPTSPPAEPGQPTPVLKQDCTTMTVGLHNPEDGTEFTLNFKTSKGEERSDVVEPGGTGTGKFSATPGFTVTLSITGVEGSTTVAYEQPEDCDTAGGGGGLPTTGAAAGGIAAGAAGLLIAGGVLFFLARRRKVRFTA